MGKQYEYDIEAIVKAKLDEATQAAVEKKLNETTKDRTVNIDMNSKSIDGQVKEAKNVSKQVNQISEKQYKADVAAYKKASNQKIAAQKKLYEYDTKNIGRTVNAEQMLKDSVKQYKKYKDTGDDKYLKKAVSQYSLSRHYNSYLDGDAYKDNHRATYRVKGNEKLSSELDKMRSDDKFNSYYENYNKERNKLVDNIEKSRKETERISNKYLNNSDYNFSDTIFEQSDKETAARKDIFNKTNEKYVKYQEQLAKRREKRKTEKASSSTPSVQEINDETDALNQNAEANSNSEKAAKKRAKQIKDAVFKNKIPPTNNNIRDDEDSDDEIRAINRRVVATKDGDKEILNTRYASGRKTSEVDGNLQSTAKDVFDLDKSYKALNQNVKTYYDLKLKMAKGDNSEKTQLAVEEAKNNIIKERNKILEANEAGYYSDELETYRQKYAKASHNDYISEMQKMYTANKNAAQVKENNRLKQQDAKDAKQSAEYAKQKEKDAKQEALSKKKIQDQIKKARDTVSDSSMRNLESELNSKLSKYAGQDSTTQESLKNARTLRDEIIKLQSDLSKAFKDGTSDNDILKIFDELNSKIAEFNTEMSTTKNSMEISLDTSKLGKAKTDITDFLEEYDQFLTETQKGNLNTLSNQYSEGLTKSGKDDLDKQVEAIKKVAQTEKEIQAIRKETESGSFEVRTAKIDSTLSKYTGQTGPAVEKLRAQAKAVKEAQEELKNALSADTIDASRVKAAYSTLEDSVEKYGNALKVVKEVETTSLGEGVATKASNSVQTYINNNSKALKKYRVELENLRDAYKDISTVGEKNTLDARFSNLKARISAEGLSGSSWSDDLKRAFTQISQFAGIYGIAQNLFQDVPRQIVSAVKDVNAAQVELRKVSDAPDSQLVEYWDQAAESAKKYGATVSDVISSTADWSRLGYSLDEAKQLSDMTTLLHKVGDNMTQESSSEGLISTLRGFKMQASEAQKIVDVANQVANTEPIDTSGIFEAMQRSASSLSAAGNTYEQSVALATAANSVVQDSQKIGTALKTISMRIRGAETEMQQEGLDTEGMATSTAKLRKEVLALSGVDIMKNANEFKSTYDILDELSNKWSELTDIQQASVTELIAGELDFASIYRNINKRTYLIARAA